MGYFQNALRCVGMRSQAPKFRSLGRGLDQQAILWTIDPLKLLVDTSAASEFDRF
jgi:hypothetical protein